ncbi:MAG: sigma-70 family RNA polymerase sigma factor [Sphingomonas sp.]|nr:sigma-70 family RNA polymerase sigma factor [Sphingomonas sp.]
MAGAMEGRAEFGGLRAYFLRERPTLLRLLKARLGNPDEAEDVLQELWLRLSTMNSAPIAQPGGYIFRMANNMATDRHRSLSASVRRESEWIETYGQSDEVVPPVEAGMLASERLRQIDAAVAALPERTARIFRLYRYEDVPRRTIAELIGISVSAIEKHLQVAYRAIHALEGADDDEPGTAGEQER